MLKKRNIKTARIGTPKGSKQTFSFTAPTAANVHLVGDFTHWQEKPINLQKDTDGMWRTTVELPPGEHRYRFLVDGEWCDDSECVRREPNPYGSHDCVREVA